MPKESKGCWGVSAMGLDEYISMVTGQMRCKRARLPVAKELADHIADQKEAYMAEGMDAEKAEAEAVRQMGDAVEVGLEMDRIHRPRMDWKVLGLIGIFSVAACIFQGMLVTYQKGGEIFYENVWMSIVQVGVGLLIMTAILFLDYTYFAKKPLAVWLVLAILLPLANGILADGSAGGMADRVCSYVLIGLLLPAYGGLVYYYRQKGWKGLILCFLWLITGTVLSLRTVLDTFTIVMICFSCLLLLIVSIVAGWFAVPRFPALVVTGTAVVGGVAGMFFYIMNFGYSYQQARMRAVYCRSDENVFYITGRMQELLRNLEFVGKENIADNWIPWEGANSLLFIGSRLGLLVMLLFIAGLAVLLAIMAAGILKQKSVFGSLMGTVCFLGLAVPVVCHILSTVGFIPYADVRIPFLYPGWIANAGFYTLLGLYLSVYRNTDVVG